MTEQKRAALKLLIKRQTKLKTRTEDTAREFLIREGIYTSAGELAKSFGGKRGSAKASPGRKRA